MMGRIRNKEPHPEQGTRRPLFPALLLVFCSLIAPTPVRAVEPAPPCPAVTEQARQQSLENPATQKPYAAQLPDCRAYELVSPGENLGPVSPSLAEWVDGAHSTQRQAVFGGGNLPGALGAAVEVQGVEPAVFWDSLGTPPGTGALPDGGSFDAFGAVRTPSGWNTRDVQPYADPFPGQGRQERKLLIGASQDASAALIATNAILTPGDFEEPQQPRTEEGKRFFYRVPMNGSGPELITHAEYLEPFYRSTFPAPYWALSASPDLREVAFGSEVPLEKNDVCNYYPRKRNSGENLDEPNGPRNIALA
jgi:hypothetical protein